MATTVLFSSVPVGILLVALTTVAHAAPISPAVTVKVTKLESSQLTFVMRVDLSPGNEDGALDVALLLAESVVVSNVRVGDGQRWYPVWFGGIEKVHTRFRSKRGVIRDQPGPIKVYRPVKRFVVVHADYYPQDIAAVIEVTATVPLCHDQANGSQVCCPSRVSVQRWT
jgi:hypothetical protein